MGKFFESLKKAGHYKMELTGADALEKTEELSTITPEVPRLPTTSPLEEMRKLPLSPPKIDPHLVTLFDTSSQTLERFKLLRAKLLLSNLGGQVRTIMVTSAQPLDGKSIVSANLAATIAGGIYDYSLLVDCDLRKPNLHQLFGLQTNKGLREYLDEGSSLASCLQKTSMPKLTLLPSGRPPINPSELISSEKMKLLIEEMKCRYQDRYIILDTPPATFAAEVGFLANIVDGILLVVRSGKTRSDQLTKAIKNIGSDKILGLIFYGSNEFDRTFYYYNQYYSKGQQTSKHFGKGLLTPGRTLFSFKKQKR